MTLRGEAADRRRSSTRWASTSSRRASRSPRTATSRRSAEIAKLARERGDLRPRPRQPRRHRPLLGGGAPRAGARASTPSSAPRRCTARSTNLDKDAMAERIHDTVTHARNLCDNVQWSPMDATRTEHDYPGAGRRDRDQGRRHHDQHPRHRRLHRAARERRADPHAARAGAGRGRGGLRHPLPQRPRHGDGERAGRGRGRRAADRVHDQRPRRAGRQHRARGGGDGDAGAQRHHAVPDRDRHHARSCRRAGWSPPSRASRCSSTRRSSARTPSPTRAASTRTAC